MIIELNFEKINSEKLDSETSKLQPVIYQKRPDILPVYIKERLTLYKALMFLSQSDPSSVMTN